MTSRPTLSPIKTAWYKWKSQRWVPGRKKFLVGFDLQNNTFWEFRDTLSSHQQKMRRIVQYPRVAHLSDVQVSPQWLQWLRHTRKEAPSIEEQEGDVARRERLKILAAQADARWAGKGSLLDQPKREVERGLQESGVGNGAGRQETGSVRADEIQEESTRQSKQNSNIEPEAKEIEDPWKQAKGGPSEEWQPQAWGGGKSTIRR